MKDGVTGDRGRDVEGTRETLGRLPLRARAILGSMIPLALSGTVVIGVAVPAALLLVWSLLRMERREEAAELLEEEARPAAEAPLEEAARTAEQDR